MDCAVQLLMRMITVQTGRRAPCASLRVPASPPPTLRRRRRPARPAQGACFSAPATADDRAGYPAPHKMAAAYQPGMQAPSGVVSGYPAAPPYPQHSYMPASHSQPLPPAAQHSGYWSMPPAYSYPQPGYGGGAYPPPYPGMPPPVGALPPPQPGDSKRAAGFRVGGLSAGAPL